MSEVLIFILALPLLALAIGWALLCAPLMMLFAGPIWAVLTWIDMLKGKDTHFWAMVYDLLTMGAQMWCETTNFCGGF